MPRHAGMHDRVVGAAWLNAHSTTNWRHVALRPGVIDDVGGVAVRPSRRRRASRGAADTTTATTRRRATARRAVSTRRSSRARLRSARPGTSMASRSTARGSRWPGGPAPLAASGMFSCGCGSGSVGLVVGDRRRAVGPRSATTRRRTARRPVAVPARRRRTAPASRGRSAPRSESRCRRSSCRASTWSPADADGDVGDAVVREDVAARRCCRGASHSTKPAAPCSIGSLRVSRTARSDLVRRRDVVVGVLLGERHQADAGLVVVPDQVALDHVVDAAGRRGCRCPWPGARRRSPGCRPGCCVDEVADDRRVRARGSTARSCRSWARCRPGCCGRRVDDQQVAAGVGARVAEAVVLRDDVGRSRRRTGGTAPM